MKVSVQDAAPQAEETLAKYIQRLRAECTSTQKELSLKAGIHIQTIPTLRINYFDVFQNDALTR